MNLSTFLNRIGYNDPVTIDLNTLTCLQRAFVHTVPFENLNIHQGVALNYESDAVYEKIVMKRRGGLCYECNGLFHDALTLLGFDVAFIAAKMFPDERARDLYDHMALLVKLNNSHYLVDVGNGKNFGAPLGIDGSNKTAAEGQNYQVRSYDENHLGLFTSDKNNTDAPAWQARYAFNLTQRTREYFQDACHYIESSPESTFVQKRLVTMPVGRGRVTLSDNTLIQSAPDKATIKREVSDNEYSLFLQNTFGLTD